MQCQIGVWEYGNAHNNLTMLAASVDAVSIVGAFDQFPRCMYVRAARRAEIGDVYAGIFIFILLIGY